MPQSDDTPLSLRTERIKRAGEKQRATTQPGFPATRLRRTRMQDWSRRLVRETHLGVDNLVWPLFVIEGDGARQTIESMPGVERLSIDLAIEAAKEAFELGLPAIALFPYTEIGLRDEVASEACNPANLICRAVRAIKAEVPDIGIICDVALDPYTSHGHDGIIVEGEIDNDRSLEVLVRQALVQAEAGCDILAPSDMMDGRIGAMRAALEEAGYTNTKLLSYAVKYASGFYAPFRDAVGSGAMLKGDKQSYQMDPANSEEAIREVALDIAEGADMVMIKPGLPYLDVLYRVKQTFGVPTFAYQTSGEYAMLSTGAANGCIARDAAIMETLMCYRRAGADAIFTYFAREVAERLKAEA